PRLLRAFTALSIAGLAPALATAQTTLTTFFGDSGSTAFGQQGVWDTEVVRSGTASWRVTYPDQWSIHAIQATESSTLASSLAPYAGAGWFELYYRSSMDGTI